MVIYSVNDLTQGVYDNDLLGLIFFLNRSHNWNDIETKRFRNCLKTGFESVLFQFHFNFADSFMPLSFRYRRVLDWLANDVVRAQEQYRHQHCFRRRWPQCSKRRRWRDGLSTIVGRRRRTRVEVTTAGGTCCAHLPTTSTPAECRRRDQRHPVWSRTPCNWNFHVVHSTTTS